MHLFLYKLLIGQGIRLCHISSMPQCHAKSLVFMCGFSEVPHLLNIIGHVHKVHAAHASMFNNRRYKINNYPNGTDQVVWLPDASVGCLFGKHIFLFVSAIHILLAGIVYKLLLRLPDKLYHFIETFALLSCMLHTCKFEHRYWTSLLLLVRVIVYVATASNVCKSKLSVAPVGDYRLFQMPSVTTKHYFISSVQETVGI